MNAEGLNELWPYAWRLLGPVDTALAQAPQSWVGLAAAEQDGRIAAFKKLASTVFVEMPMTLSFVTNRVVDAYLVSTDQAGVALIVDFEDQGVLVSYCGFAPKGAPRFIGKVGEFYGAMDGFTDLMFFGGLLQQERIEPLSAHHDFYETPPSSDVAARLKDRSYLRVFNNGASGYAYLEASTADRDDPDGLALWTDDDEPLIDRPFWSLIDNWTYIAMGGG